MTGPSRIRRVASPPPLRANQFREAAFVPTIAVNEDGVLAVTYYDFRRDDNTGELTDQFALFCNPASSNCANAANWRRERCLIPEAFDILDAPVARGHFLGDYMGSESTSADVHPADGVADGADQTSVVTRKLSIAAVVATTAAIE